MIEQSVAVVMDDLDTLEALHGVAEDLAGKFELRTLLERILRRSVELLGGDAGSICSVDEEAGVYRKEADFGVACQAGRVFPLTEGITGAVARRRGPVVFADYREIPGCHVEGPDRATLRGVVGVPILWRQAVVGACVVFSRDRARRFTAADAGILEIFARHAAVALANARLYQEADARARAEAASAERDRLVREVHDTVAQGLASVVVHLEAATRSLHAGDDRGVGDEMRRARESALTALAETRRTVLGLAPSPLEGRSLEEALDLELRWANRTGQLDVRLVVAGEPVGLDDHLAHQLFRIAQEALTNAVQHAGANSIRIGLVYDNDAVTLLVQDDGCGFERPRPAEAAVGQIGMRGMAERARLIGGTLDVDSVPGWGTRVRVSAPVSFSPAEGASPGQVRVLVVARHPIARAGIVRVLASQEPALQVVGDVDDFDAGVDAYQLLEPDVVLVHLDPNDPHEVSGIHALRAVAADAVVLALCSSSGDRSAGALFRVGASGWLADSADGAELTNALLAAAQGRVVVPRAVLDGLADDKDPAGRAATLTRRESEVCRLVQRGLRDKQIAESLVISVKTVEKHVGAILRKTGAANRTELAALANDVEYGFR